jgi:ribosomal-protein-serine acetyltransferase
MFTKNLGDDARLVQLELHHAEDIFALIDGNRAHLRQWLPFVDGTRSVADSSGFIKGNLERFARDGSFDAGIFQDDKLVGVIGLHWINWSHRITSLGYWLSADAQGRGLMTRSVNAMLEHCFSGLGLNRVQSAAATGNERSNAVLRRCGFTLEGVSRDAEWLYDHYVDHNLYGLLEREWRAGAHPPTLSLAGESGGAAH